MGNLARRARQVSNMDECFKPTFQQNPNQTALLFSDHRMIPLFRFRSVCMVLEVDFRRARFNRLSYEILRVAPFPDSLGTRVDRCALFSLRYEICILQSQASMVFDIL
jgi:hypothetical protein